MEVKEESEKVGLKFNIQKTKIMASGPITSWQIEGEKGEAATDFIFLSSKITADDDSSQEIKTLALWKKSYDKHRQCIKNRDIIFIIMEESRGKLKSLLIKVKEESKKLA